MRFRIFRHSAMCMPPDKTAGIRTETLCFPVRMDNHVPPTLQACRFRNIRRRRLLICSDIVSPTERLDRVSRQSQLSGNLRAAFSGASVSNNVIFFCVRHKTYPFWSDRPSVPHMREKGPDCSGPYAFLHYILLLLRPPWNTCRRPSQPDHRPPQRSSRWQRWQPIQRSYRREPW